MFLGTQKNRLNEFFEYPKHTLLKIFKGTPGDNVNPCQIEK